jgi:2-acylglycerol O-acyltransferase 2
VTLNATFLTPIFREWILALGFISANKETLKQTLASRKSIVLVAGGAAESLHCQRDTLKLYLKKRQGFVRLAMETGKPLVPCLGFGENEIFDTLVTSKGDVGIKGMLYLFQQAFMKLTTVGPPIITNPTPRSVQLSVVVGAPVDMDMRKTVEENHVRYMQAISKLFEKHASQLGYGHVKLEIV